MPHPVAKRNEMINVLVAVDLCDHSPLTLEVAHALARGTRGTITVLHVVRLPAASSEEEAASYEDWSRMKTYALVSAETTLKRLLNRIGLGSGEEEGADVEIRVAVGSSPVQAISEEAKRIGADLIVVGVHERPYLGWLLAGGTGRSLQRRAHCPVISVRSGVAEEIARKAKSKGPRRTPIAAEVME